jgi:hypothetical protein
MRLSFEGVEVPLVEANYAGRPVREGLSREVGKDILLSEGDGKSKSRGNGCVFYTRRSERE